MTETMKEAVGIAITMVAVVVLTAAYLTLTPSQRTAEADLAAYQAEGGAL